MTGRLAPDHKTIAGFRRDNGSAIRKICAQFVELCRRNGARKGACIAIDGSKFKAVNNRDRNLTKARIADRPSHREAGVDRYIKELICMDRQEQGGARAQKVETGVLTGFPTVVSPDVTNPGFDRGRLPPMARAARTALGVDDLHDIADSGCFRGLGILAGHRAGISTIIPPPETSGYRSKGMFVTADFLYDPERDVHRCPAGHEPTYR